MDNFSVVLTSSVLAASLTSIVNWLLQRNSFRNDYYKKIIEIRMDRYGKVYQIISRLQSIELDSDDNKMHGTFTSFEYYQSFMVALVKESLESVWLSKDFSTKLSSFNFLLNKTFGEAHDENAIPDERMKEIAIKNYEVVTLRKHELLNQIAIDLSTLHKVTDFLNSKKQNS